MRALWALAAAWLAIAAPALAQDEDADHFERVTEYKSDIVVAADGTLSVHETITVNARGSDIRHGIFRDFPTLYPDGVHVRFDVSRVTRDGHDEAYAIGGLDNGRRVRIGDANAVLAYGLHTYTIDYTTDRQIAFFPNYDELYWNVTGNGWRLRIDAAEATVHLPAGARILQHAFYTGPQGSKAQNAVAERIDDSTIRFRTTEILGREEGFTIGVGFAKGAVAPPTLAARVSYFVRDHRSLAAFLIGLAILIVYFGIAWTIGGRDPSGGTLIPLFAPPDNLSPASLRYLVRMSYDGKMFSAALVSMAVKGFLTITQNANATYTLKKTGRKGRETGLSPDESETAHGLFAGGDTIALIRLNHTAVNRAIGALSRWLGNAFDTGYLVRNWRLFRPGLAIAALALLAIILCADNPGSTALILLWSSMTGTGTFVFGYACFAIWKDVFTSSKGRVGGAILGALMLLPVAVFGAMTVGIVFFLYDTVPPITIAMTATIVAVVIVFHRLLRAPTPEGARLLTAIKGFRLFLTTAEEDRLKMLNPPDVTPELFEKFLPYAIALDCETEWGKTFQAAAARAGLSATETHSYGSTWYSGGSLGNIGSAGFATAIGASLATATVSAAASPSSSSSSGSSFSSSSGSSGGGSSGGGGGGGGGGGW
jgi:uncharacterized membrane protein YgcG